MVGGGIFAVLGVAANDAGGGTPVAFLVGGLIAALTAYSYTMLSVTYPDAGGTIAFVDRVFGIGTLTGSLNVVLWTGYIATTGLYAAAFGNYAASLLPGGASTSGVATRLFAVVGVLIPWIINLAKAGLIARTESIVVAIKLGILLAVIVAGLPEADSSAVAPSSWPSAVSVVAAGMLVFVAYEGFELIANASDDVRNPTRTLPRAFGLSVGIVIVLYVLIAVVVVGTLSADQIAASSEFALAEATSTVLGQTGFVLVALSAVLATFSAINATLYGAARLSYTLAVTGELPPQFRRRPWHQPIGLHVTSGIGLAIAVGLPLSSISTLSSSIFLVVFAVVNAAAVKASREVRARRGIAVFGTVGCLAAFVILTAHSITGDPTALIVLGVLVSAALICEHLVLRHRRSRDPGQDATPDDPAR